MMAVGAKKGGMAFGPRRLSISGLTNNERRGAAYLLLNERDPMRIRPGLALAAIRLSVDNLLGTVRTNLDDRVGLMPVVRRVS
jgi:hypothetical protein